MSFQKAVKSRSKLRASVFGPSGSGKTYSALSVGSGMGGRMALIDSERGSASKYADRFDFDTVDLETKTVQEYIDLINVAAKAGYDVLVIDSLSHAWQTLNEEVEKLADAKFKGNYWAAWSEGTPMQRKLVNAILSYPGHIIATMRSKTEWQAGGGDNKKPVRIGLAPEQGKGIEYEFDILLEISPEHRAHIIKDRTGKFQDRVVEKPGKDFGEELIAWLNEGSDLPPRKTREQMATEYKAIKAELDKIMETKATAGAAIFTETEKGDVVSAIAALKGREPQECIDATNNILTEQKVRLQERMGSKQETEPVATQETTTATTVQSQPPKDDSLSGEFQRRINEKKAGKPTQEDKPAAPPSMFTEPEPEHPDDYFEDDIPGDEQMEKDLQDAALVEADAELDIF